MITETRKRKIIMKELEKEPNLLLSPNCFSLNFLREWRDHVPSRNHYYWIINQPKTEEQKKIWKEFGPKE